jgi:hypothetical protein
MGQLLVAALREVLVPPALVYVDRSRPHTVMDPRLEPGTAPVIGDHHHIAIPDATTLGIRRVHLQQRLSVQLAEP